MPDSRALFAQIEALESAVGRAPTSDEYRQLSTLLAELQRTLCAAIHEIEARRKEIERLIEEGEGQKTF